MGLIEKAAVTMAGMDICRSLSRPIGPAVTLMGALKLGWCVPPAVEEWNTRAVSSLLVARLVVYVPAEQPLPPVRAAVPSRNLIFSPGIVFAPLALCKVIT